MIVPAVILTCCAMDHQTVLHNTIYIIIWLILVLIIQSGDSGVVCAFNTEYILFSLIVQKLMSCDKMGCLFDIEDLYRYVHRCPFNNNKHNMKVKIKSKHYWKLVGSCLLYVLYILTYILKLVPRQKIVVISPLHKMHTDRCFYSLIFFLDDLITKWL